MKTYKIGNKEIKGIELNQFVINSTEAIITVGMWNQLLEALNGCTFEKEDKPQSLKNGLTQPTTAHQWSDIKEAMRQDAETTCIFCDDSSPNPHLDYSCKHKTEPKSTLREEIMGAVRLRSNGGLVADKIISLFKDTLLKEISGRVLISYPKEYIYHDDIIKIIKSL